jgi:hypothetical protein
MNNSHTLKAFERSHADFLPPLSMPSDTKMSQLFVVGNTSFDFLIFGADPSDRNNLRWFNIFHL